MRNKSIIAQLSKKITASHEDKWFPKFEKHSRYMGNGIYSIGRHYSTSTRELFLMFVADMENIEYKGKKEEPEDEVE